MLNGRTLVTGATGCLGSNLIRSLIASGEDVVILKRHGEPLGALSHAPRSFEIRFGDVRDYESLRKALAGITRVYHLAGIAIPLNRYERSMWEVNVVGTYNVLRSARENQVQRVVHVSSTAAIGYPPDGFTADENFPFADSVASNSYSLTKHRGEEIALRFNAECTQVVVVNPAAVIAPGGSLRYGWAAALEAILHNRMPFYPCGGSAFCSRRDMVDGLIKAMGLGRPGHRYILNSQNVSYRELIRQIAEAVSTSAPRLRAPRWLCDCIGKVNDCAAWFVKNPAKSPMLVSENTTLMSRMLFYDQAKALGELGISQTPIRESILELHEWYRTERRYAFA